MTYIRLSGDDCGDVRMTGGLISIPSPMHSLLSMAAWSGEGGVPTAAESSSPAIAAAACAATISCTIGICRFCLLRMAEMESDAYMCFSGTTCRHGAESTLYDACYCDDGWGMHASVGLLKAAFSCAEGARPQFTVSNVALGSRGGLAVLVHAQNYILVACVRLGVSVDACDHMDVEMREEIRQSLARLAEAIDTLVIAEGVVPFVMISDFADAVLSDFYSLARTGEKPAWLACTWSCAMKQGCLWSAPSAAAAAAAAAVAVTVVAPTTDSAYSSHSRVQKVAMTSSCHYPSCCTIQAVNSRVSAITCRQVMDWGVPSMGCAT